MGFYYLISAALQRRVYLGSDTKPLFPNQYMIFVGPPGIGKGLVLTEVADILRHHKLRKNLSVPRTNTTPSTTDPKKDEAKEEMDAAAHRALMLEFKQANPHLPKEINGSITKQLREPLAIPVAADTTTYEALIRAHANSLRTAHYTSDSKLLKNGMYTHSSLCFCLEEISSLFRKHSDDVSRYLLRAYDCTNYEYDAKTPGLEDYVLSPCLNMLGGTQQSFIQEIFKDKLLTEGFASRTIFIPEAEPRGHTYDMFTFSAEQLAAKRQLINHVEKLIGLFGNVKQTPAAYEFIKAYVEGILPKKSLRPNQSGKLDSYYARKRVHIEKMALAIHFAESLEMVIDLPPYQKAIEVLDNLEKTMDSALIIAGKNPLGNLADKVLKTLKTEGSMTFVGLWRAHVDDLNERQLTEVIDFLARTGKVGIDPEHQNNPVKFIAL